MGIQDKVIGELASRLWRQHGQSAQFRVYHAIAGAIGKRDWRLAHQLCQVQARILAMQGPSGCEIVDI